MDSNTFVVMVSAVFGFAAICITISTLCLMTGGALYLGTPRAFLRAMLRLASLQPGEKVYDLGCGDGRLLIAARRQFRAVATGIDISPWLIALAWLRSRLFRAPIRLIRDNVLTADFADADVVFCFLMPELMTRLEARFRLLRPGTRIISHRFEIPGWVPVSISEVRCWLATGNLYEYRVAAAGHEYPLPAADTTAAAVADRIRWNDGKYSSFY